MIIKKYEDDQWFFSTLANVEAGYLRQISEKAIFVGSQGTMTTFEQLATARPLKRKKNCDTGHRPGKLIQREPVPTSLQGSSRKDES